MDLCCTGVVFLGYYGNVCSANTKIFVVGSRSTECYDLDSLQAVYDFGIGQTQMFPSVPALNLALFQPEGWLNTQMNPLDQYKQQLAELQTEPQDMFSTTHEVLLGVSFQL